MYSFENFLPLSATLHVFGTFYSVLYEVPRSHILKYYFDKRVKVFKNLKNMYLIAKGKSKLYIYLLTIYMVYYVSIEPGQSSPPMFSNKRSKHGMQYTCMYQN